VCSGEEKRWGSGPEVAIEGWETNGVAELDGGEAEGEVLLQRRFA
jgi:hypothetical protein